MAHLGKILIMAGLALAAAGILLVAGDRLPIRFGRLPGDFLYRNGNTTIYVPVVTSLLLSLFASLIVWLLSRR
jgi:hypothetical protein